MVKQKTNARKSRERERNRTIMAMRAAKSINVKIKTAKIDLGLFFFVDSKPLEFSDGDKHMEKGPWSPAFAG